MPSRDPMKPARWIGLAPLLLCWACGGGGGDAVGVAPTPADPCATAPASSQVFNVKDAPYNAKGDGITDDTMALQRAVDAAAGTGGTVLVPLGTYLVNAVGTSNQGIVLKSNLTFAMASGAELKAIPNASANYAILIASGINHVTLTGGTLTGERGAHSGSTGEWGHGLSIGGGSQAIKVVGLTVRECWGDGIYVGLASELTFCGVVADHNRRQGMSITAANHVQIRNSTFKNTAGTLPECGIDLEPNSGDTVNDVLITGCTFTHNAGGGLQDGVPIAYSGLSHTLNVVVDGNTFTSNGAGTLSSSPRSGIEVSNVAGHRITNNTVTLTTGNGILLRNGVTGTTVSGNTVTNNTQHGIFEYLSSGNTISGNTVSGNGLTP